MLVIERNNVGLPQGSVITASTPLRISLCQMCSPILYILYRGKPTFHGLFATPDCLRISSSLLTLR